MSAAGAGAGRVWIFANPGSGAGPNRARVEALAGSLARRGFAAECHWQIPEAPSADAAESAHDRPAAVIAAGGDGTMNRVVQLGLAAPHAVFPLGTQNLLARKYGFPRDPERFAERIAAGRTRAIDLGLAGAQRFLLMASAGFDAEVVARLDRWRRSGGGVRRVRNATYALPATRAFFAYRHPRLLLRTEREEVPGALAFAFNLDAYACLLRVAPHASETDGELDWVVLRRGGRSAFLRFAWALLRGRHLELPDVVHGRARRIRIEAESEAAVPVQIDGDAAGSTPVELSVLPAALTLFTGS